MSKMETEQWECLECCQRGEISKVRLLQISPTHAIYICENKKCLYPGSSVKKLLLLKRSPDEMQLTCEELSAFGLPVSLQNEEGLNTSYLNKLLELKALVPYLKNILEAEDKWSSFTERMKSVELDIQKPTYSSSTDPDLVKFKEASVYMGRFLNHLIPDHKIYMSLLTTK